MSYWFLIPIVISFSFFSKQIPASFIAIALIFSFVHHILFNKKNSKEILSTVIFSIFFCVLFYLFILKIFNIDFSLFFKQYFLYPLTIGEGRIGIFSLDLRKIFFELKFLHLSILFYLILNIYYLAKKKNYFRSSNFKIFFIFIQFYFFLILSQLITKNQIYIFFLIPIYSLLSFLILENSKIKYKNFLKILVVGICFFSTLKYFERFVIHKKFHELEKVNFENSIKGENLNKIFKNLNWITPENLSLNNNKIEIKKIAQNVNLIKADKRKKMIFSNYSFYSILTNESSLSPSRWFPQDGTGFPVRNGEYKEIYEDYLSDLISSKEIEVIYFLDEINDSVLLNYINSNCFELLKNNNIQIYKVLKSCKDFNR